MCVIIHFGVCSAAICEQQANQEKQRLFPHCKFTGQVTSQISLFRESEEKVSDWRG